MTLEDLVAREEIRQLRVDYSTAFDTMNEAHVREIFTDDAVLSFPDRYAGIETILGLYHEHWKDLQAPFETLHYIANHSIEISGPDTAIGHCLLLDLVTHHRERPAFVPDSGKQNPLLLIGRYEDRYVKVGGRWKFAEIKLQILWPARGE